MLAETHEVGEAPEVAAEAGAADYHPIEFGGASFAVVAALTLLFLVFFD